MKKTKKYENFYSANSGEQSRISEFLSKGYKYAVLHDSTYTICYDLDQARALERKIKNAGSTASIMKIEDQ